jgi:hypothetical protein
MAKRKKRSKVQKQAKVREGNSAKRSKARRVSKSARGKAAKRTVAIAKPKRPTAKKPAGKEIRRIKRPVVETVVVDVIEEPAPGVIAVTEVEETVVRQENPGPG